MTRSRVATIVNLKLDFNSSRRETRPCSFEEDCMTWNGSRLSMTRSNFTRKVLLSRCISASQAAKFCVAGANIGHKPDVELNLNLDSKRTQDSLETCRHSDGKSSSARQTALSHLQGSLFAGSVRSAGRKHATHRESRTSTASAGQSYVAWSSARSSRHAESASDKDVKSHTDHKETAEVKSAGDDRLGAHVPVRFVVSTSECSQFSSSTKTSGLVTSAWHCLQKSDLINACDKKIKNDIVRRQMHQMTPYQAATRPAEESFRRQAKSCRLHYKEAGARSFCESIGYEFRMPFLAQTNKLRGEAGDKDQILVEGSSCHTQTSGQRISSDTTPVTSVSPTPGRTALHTPASGSKITKEGKEQLDAHKEDVLSKVKKDSKRERRAKRFRPLGVPASLKTKQPSDEVGKVEIIAEHIPRPIDHAVLSQDALSYQQTTSLATEQSPRTFRRPSLFAVEFEPTTLTPEHKPLPSERRPSQKRSFSQTTLKPKQTILTSSQAPSKSDGALYEKVTKSAEPSRTTPERKTRTFEQTAPFVASPQAPLMSGTDLLTSETPLAVKSSEIQPVPRQFQSYTKGSLASTRQRALGIRLRRSSLRTVSTTPLAPPHSSLKPNSKTSSEASKASLKPSTETPLGCQVLHFTGTETSQMPGRPSLEPSSEGPLPPGQSLKQSINRPLASSQPVLEASMILGQPLLQPSSERSLVPSQRPFQPSRKTPLEFSQTLLVPGSESLVSGHSLPRSPGTAQIEPVTNSCASSGTVVCTTPETLAAKFSQSRSQPLPPLPGEGCTKQSRAESGEERTPEPKKPVLTYRHAELAVRSSREALKDAMANRPIVNAARHDFRWMTTSRARSERVSASPAACPCTPVSLSNSGRSLREGSPPGDCGSLGQLTSPTRAVTSASSVSSRYSGLGSCTLLPCWKDIRPPPLERWRSLHGWGCRLPSVGPHDHLLPVSSSLGSGAHQY